MTEPTDSSPAFLNRDDLRLLLFGGKGGVGKTTCAAAAALRLANHFPRRTFLLVSTDPAHSLRHTLDDAPLPPNLKLLELDARQLFEQFRTANAGHVRTIAGRGTFLDGGDISRLLDLSLPGLDEVMAFIRIAALVEADPHACVVVDTAPTGHTLRLLRMPAFFRRWLDALDALLAKHRYLAALYRGSVPEDDAHRFLQGLAGSLDALARVLQDADRCLFVPVLRAERIIVAETRRLVEALQAHCVPRSDLIVNALHPTGSACPTCRERAEREALELRRIVQHFAGYRLWTLPLLETEPHGHRRLGAFWNDARPIHPPSPARREPELVGAAR